MMERSIQYGKLAGVEAIPRVCVPSGIVFVRSGNIGGGMRALRSSDTGVDPDTNEKLPTRVFLI